MHAFGDGRLAVHRHRAAMHTAQFSQRFQLEQVAPDGFRDPQFADDAVGRDLLQCRQQRADSLIPLFLPHNGCFLSIAGALHAGRPDDRFMPSRPGAVGMIRPGLAAQVPGRGIRPGTERQAPDAAMADSSREAGQQKLRKNLPTDLSTGLFGNGSDRMGSDSPDLETAAGARCVVSVAHSRHHGAMPRARNGQEFALSRAAIQMSESGLHF